MKIKIKFVDFFDEKGTTEIFKPFLEEALKEIGEVVISDAPDYVICSCNGSEVCKYDCTRIQWIGENERPNFNIYDYAVGFDDMQFEDRYLHLPWYERPHYLDKTKSVIFRNSTASDIEDFLKRPVFCNFIVSNGSGNAIRNLAFEALMKYKRVESGGCYKNNQPQGKPVSEKTEFQRRSRFTIAFENAATNGYNTEKILDAFFAGTIPIYWGDPKIAEVYNERAFINCNNCKNGQEIVDLVRNVEESQELQKQMLQEPVFFDTEKILADLKQDRFGKFIRQIVLQGPQKSQRRSKDFWNAKYETDFRQTGIIKKTLAWKAFSKIEKYARKKKT